jgi:hypothetical protein
MYKVVGKFRSDMATFIQDRGQVPFEPQIQRTFSMDKKSNYIVQSNASPTLRSETLNQKRCKRKRPSTFTVVPHRPPISPFPESAGPIATDHPLLVLLQSVLGSELIAVANRKLLVPKTSECAIQSHTPVIAT